MTERSDLTDRLQQAIEAVYRLDRGPPVRDFHIGRTLFEHAVGPSDRDYREALLVQQEGEETHLALFICEKILDRARAFLDRPGGESLDAFCVATEGVSHYVYFTYCGDQDRPVSQVELELQAEVDKFLVLRALLNIDGEALLDALFDRARLSDALSPEEIERYAVAHRAGRRYARWVSRTFDRGEGTRALDDARRLYRKSLPAKLEHIARAA